MMQRQVYFIKPVGMDGPVKIGCSNSPEQRLETLATWSPYPLEIVATVPGDLKLERNIQDCFANSYSHREWFNSTPELTALMNALAGGANLEAVLDLSKTQGRTRIGKRGYKMTEEQRLRISYSSRLRWVGIKHSRAVGKRFVSPQDADAIVSRWYGNMYREPIRPSEAEMRRLDEVLADPGTHFVTADFRYASAKSSASPEQRAS